LPFALPQTPQPACRQVAIAYAIVRFVYLNFYFPYQEYKTKFCKYQEIIKNIEKISPPSLPNNLYLP
jgi:hypothetical protein